MINLYFIESVKRKYAILRNNGREITISLSFKVGCANRDELEKFRLESDFPPEQNNIKTGVEISREKWKKDGARGGKIYEQSIQENRQRVEGMEERD